MCGWRGGWRQSYQLFVSDSGRPAVNDGGGRIDLNIQVKHTERSIQLLVNHSFVHRHVS